MKKYYKYSENRMNFKEMQLHIESILGSLDGNLPSIAAEIEGMTSIKIRYLLNQIVGIEENWLHLEVGCNKGATLISSLYNNLTAKGVAYEDFSENETKIILNENIGRYRPLIGDVNLIENDFFSVYENAPYHGKFNSFFYDGVHSLFAHKKAVEISNEICTKTYILIIDDWNWYDVRTGTWIGISYIQPKSVIYWDLSSRFNGDKETFHNGIGLFVIEKNNH
jgi:hypothetical protein